MLPKLSQTFNQSDPERKSLIQHLPAKLTLLIAVYSMNRAGLTAQMCLAALDIAFGSK